MPFDGHMAPLKQRQHMSTLWEQKKGDTVTSQPKPTAAVFVGGNEHHDGTAACEYQKTDNFFC